MALARTSTRSSSICRSPGHIAQRWETVEIIQIIQIIIIIIIIIIQIIQLFNCWPAEQLQQSS